MTSGDTSHRSTPTLLVAGTASHVGKSTVAAGLCRMLADRGIDVAPYKAQNMSNNARAVPKGSGDGTGEIGVAQFVQAKAARTPPTTDHNPVLLKPRGNHESQLIFNGDAVGHGSAQEYYDTYWEQARRQASNAWQRLAKTHTAIIAEGAGSIAEINFHDRDLANIETARFAEAAILLVADIERGGVFASILGTIELMPADLRERVIGVVITKFRGDKSLLTPGITQIEQRTGVPVLGVVPYEKPGLPEEDSLALPGPDEQVTRGMDDGCEQTVTVAVPRLPRISNFTDLEPLARTPGVRVSYRPIADSIADADAVVIPGSKNTVDDCLAVHEAGLADRLREFTGPIVGLCGGYQLLGKRITNADVEGTGNQTAVSGIGLLPVVTEFTTDKRVTPATLLLNGGGPLSGGTGQVEGYEIHAGRTHATKAITTPFRRTETMRDNEEGAQLGATTDTVLGTYLHGLFENQVARDAFLRTVFEHAGKQPPSGCINDSQQAEQTPYNRVASMIETHIDIERLCERAGLPSSDG